MGTIEPRKNVGAIIKAYRAMVERDPGVPPLLFAGRMTVPEESILSPDDKALLRDRVLFFGYVTDEQRKRLYREASLLVIASTDEGFGIPALEAMTVGLPVVAAARGSLPEVIGDAGLLVDADNATLLADAMRRLLDDGDLRRDLAERGLERAKRFEWGASADLLLEAFRGAIARRAVRLNSFGSASMRVSCSVRPLALAATSASFCSDGRGERTRPRGDSFSTRPSR